MLSRSSKRLELDPTINLSRRERQIMQVIFSQGNATAKQIVDAINDSPSRTAIRTTLTILVDKGWLKFDKVGREYVYSPVASIENASRGALQNVLSTFFGGSIEKLIASHFSDPDSKVDSAALLRIEKMIQQAKRSESTK